MGLTVVAGRAGSGKSRWIHTEIGRLAGADRPCVLLVPEQYTLEAERALIGALDAPGLLWVRVTSPSRLMEDVFSGTGAPGQTVIDGRGKAMALRRAAESVTPRLGVFGRVARFPGFAAAMSELISDLKSFDVSPARLLEAAGGESLFGRKMRDVAALYQAFDEFMAQRSIMDAEDRADAFIAALPGDRSLRGVPVFADGFDYLPPRFVRMLGALLGHCGNLTVSLSLCADGDAGEEIFEAGRASLRALTAEAEAAGETVSVLRLQRIGGNLSGRAAEIDHLERNLYAHPARRFKGEAAAVRLLEASSPEEEADSAAGRIAALVRGGDCRWRDVAVVCGNLPEYAPIVERVFARHGIPVFLDGRRPVLQHPAVSCLLGALCVLDRDFRDHDVLAYLKSGYAGMAPDAVEETERYVAEFGIRGRARFERPWRLGARDYGLDELNRCRAAFMEPLSELSLRTGRKASVSLWARELRGFLERLRVPEILDAETPRLEEQGLRGPAAENAQVWDAVTGLLDQAGGLLGDAPFGAGEMADLLEAGFAAAQVGVLPSGSDLVLIGDVGRTKIPRTGHLIVLGASEGSLPVRYPEGRILHDRDLARMSDAGLIAGRGAALRAAQSRQGVYAAFANPLRGLWISWPLTDGAGGARQPSPLVARVSWLLGIDPGKAPPPGHTTPAAAMKPLAAGFRALRTGKEPEARWVPALTAANADARWRGRISAMAFVPGSGTGQAIRPGVLLPRGSAVSVSQLEQYARCPFSWFVGYALSPQDWKRFGVALADAGTFVHSAVADFGRRIRAGSEDGLTPEAAAAVMDGVADDLAREYPALVEDGKGRWLAGKLRAVCRKAAEGFAAQMRQGEFRPCEYELEFGPGSGLPIVEAGSDTGVSLRGAVDRVDVYRADGFDYLRIVDYKTGAAKLELSGAMDGWQIQLWVYLQALCEGWPAVRGRPARKAGAYYFPVRDEYADAEDGGSPPSLRGLCADDPEVLRAMDRNLSLPGGTSEVANVRTDSNGRAKGGVLSASGMEAVGRGVMEKTAEMTRDIRNGEVASRPLRISGRLDCAFCPYRPACRSWEPPRPRRPSPGESVDAWIDQYRVREDLHA